MTITSKWNYYSYVRYWWVNQNQTYRFEVGAGFLWSPKTKSDGGRNYFYDSMTEVAPGDIVFSYAESMIKAVGVVQGSATTSPKPDFAGAGEKWSQEGWYVEVEYLEIAKDYSTPNSNHFVNGVLDKLVREFQIEKRMVKEGRGLH